MTAARYWRLIALEAHAGADLELSALHLYDGTGRVDAAATLTCTIAPAAGTLAALQDEDMASTCRFAAAAVRASGFAITWDMGVGNTADVLGPRLAGPSRDTFLASCTLQYSADGQLWEWRADFARYDFPESYAYTNAPTSDVDTHFEKVSLLLRMDGTDGSTTFVDSSASSKAVTAIGGAKISTAQSKWGGASGYFDGTDDALSVPHASDLNLSSGDFSIELWLYLLGNLAGAYLIDKDGVENTSYPSYGVTAGSGGVALHLGSGNGTYSLQSFVGSTPVSANAWHHAAFCRSGSTVYGFLDGVQQFATAQTAPMVDGGKKLNIGARYNGASFPLNGYIDDLRITKGLARYTADFTPPTAPLPSDIFGGDGPVFLPPLRRAPAPWRTRISAASPVPPHSTLSAPGLLLARDTEFGGPGTIYGTTKTKGTPNAPTKARVVLLHQRSKLPVRETWSNPVTGYFEFRGIDVNQQFLTLAEDADGTYRPVAANRLTPEVL